MPELSLPTPIEHRQTNAPPELAKALGEVVELERQQFERVRELAEAQTRAILAHLRAEGLETLARIEAKLAERLAHIARRRARARWQAR